MGYNRKCSFNIIAPHVNNSKQADLDRVVQVFVAPFSKQRTQAHLDTLAPPDLR